MLWDILSELGFNIGQNPPIQYVKIYTRTKTRIIVRVYKFTQILHFNLGTNNSMCTA